MRLCFFARHHRGRLDQAVSCCRVCSLFLSLFASLHGGFSGGHGWTICGATLALPRSTGARKRHSEKPQHPIFARRCGTVVACLSWATCGGTFHSCLVAATWPQLPDSRATVCNLQNAWHLLRLCCSWR